jgi:hypothetical protein
LVWVHGDVLGCRGSEGQGRGMAPLGRLGLCSRCEAWGMWTFPVPCAPLRAKSRQLSTDTGPGVQWTPMAWESSNSQEHHKPMSTAHTAVAFLSDTTWNCRLGTEGVVWGSLGSAPEVGQIRLHLHSPKAAGVGLAQGTVLRRGQGVKPKVGRTLVGSRL